MCVRLFAAKSNWNISDQCLEFFAKMMLGATPLKENMPTSYYDANRMLSNLRKEFDRNSLLNEIHEETHIKRNGKYVDERSRITQEEYDRQLAIKQLEHPELSSLPPRYPAYPSLGFQTCGGYGGVSGYGGVDDQGQDCVEDKDDEDN
ncbi:hypothetical protein KIW84_055651 [Lathyrus oleraceus]|uniref:Uncharacterized protein n=1 Tax=Pisum sativum TaxID=3888 RepID=A0A9D4WYR6_PEA|nr:hypothetical protein KIW84_055651 [Pisum sativum]